MRRRVLTTVLAVSLVAAPAALAAKLSSPKSAHVGDSVTVKASGLDGGRYALTLVADDRPTPRAFCVARLGKRHKASSSGRVSISGRIPAKLTCYEGNGSKLGRVETSPGAYHLIVSVPRGPTGSSGNHSFVRRAFKIK
jgi:hypothetical protein